MCKIKINKLEWNVVGMSSDSDVFLSNEDENVFGITYFDKQTIYVRVDGISLKLLKRTCRHELCHATLFSYGFQPNSMDEEAICNFVETYLPCIERNTNKAYKKLKKEVNEGI